MIISRTPFRISFFGGGTDYHTWYREHGGAVLSTTINHYCYITARYLPPFFAAKSRIVWSRIEMVQDHADIMHPAVRAVLQYLAIENGVEVHHTGDLPARAGLGSSSAFTVGMLNAMYALTGRMSSKQELAAEAVHIERDVLAENVGVQDQIAAAYGGLNKITVSPDGKFNVQPMIMPKERVQSLQDHCLLFFTGVSRTASTIAASQMEAIARGDKKAELSTMRVLVDEAVGMLSSSTDISEFGRLLDETWKLKRSLSSNISPEFIDDIYARAIKAGALGGKLLGAGGGGFMVFFAPPEKHMSVLKALEDLLWVPFEFETGGSNIVFYDQSAYTPESLTRRDYHHLKQLDAELARDRASEVLEFKKAKAQSKLRLTTV
jgi:D-glycero-alpha-D-manno-heptose-7-phosphate kinase